MATIEKDLKIRIPVVPELDKRAVSNLRRDMAKVEKSFSHININYKDLAKLTKVNIKEIDSLTAGAEALGNKLSSAGQRAVKALDATNQKIKSATRKAAGIEKEAAEAARKGDKSAEAEAATKLAQVTKNISALNTKLNDQKKFYSNQIKQQQRLYRVEQKKITTTEKFANISPADSMKGIAKGLGSALTGGRGGVISGLKQAGGAAVKGLAGADARRTEKAADLAGGAEGAAMMARMGATLGMAAGMAAAAGAGFALFAKTVMAASDHMTKLNKTLTDGTGLANDFALTGVEYSAVIGNLRNAAIDSRSALMKFGMDSEATLKAVNAFGKASTGSLGRTEDMIKRLGGAGGLTKGMEVFAANAHVYGKALGMSATEVAGMMGDMVSDIGYSGENAMKTMQALVKTASTSGMPVQKFMDVFRQVLPDIDLFTNRMQELTGAIKLLSKTMSPKDVKEFMSAMGKGFDQMDFKQRMKMAFIIGPQKVARILNKDFEASGISIASQFKSFGDLGDEVQAALKAADPVKAMAEVANRGAQLGATPALIGDAMQLARNQQTLNKGGVLNTATAMRGAGVFARTKMLEEYADKFTGGDITGLGEHVVKQLGISEQEYNAIVSLKNSMEIHQESLQKTGRTSSKSLNASMFKMWKASKEAGNINKEVLDLSDENFEREMKLLSKDSSGMRDFVMRASAEDIAGQDIRAKTGEELAAEQYNVTASISDKMTSVVDYYLEKIYQILTPILNALEGLWKWGQAETEEEKKQVAENKRLNDLQIQTAADSTNRSEAMLNADEKATEQQKKSLNAMNRAIVEASGTDTSLGAWGKDDRPGQHGMLNKLQPILNQVGNISQESWGKIQSTSRTGEVFRGAATDDQRRRMESAIGGKNTKEAKAVVQEIITDLLKKGHVQEVQQILGSLSLGMAQSGVKFGPEGLKQAETREMKEAREKQERLTDVDPRTGLLRSQADAGSSSSALTSAASAAAASIPWSEKTTPWSEAPASVPASTSASTDVAMESVDLATEHASIASDQLTIAEEQIEVAEAQVAAVEEVAAVIDNGITLNNSWMQGNLKTMLDGVVLNNVRTALFEYAMLTGGVPEEIMEEMKQKGISSTSAAGYVMGGAVQKGQEKWLLDNPFQHGGYTGDGPTTERAGVVHRGEYVVPKGGTLVAGGGGGKTVNVGSVTVNIQTNDPNAVRKVIDDVFNQGG